MLVDEQREIKSHKVQLLTQRKKWCEEETEGLVSNKGAVGSALTMASAQLQVWSWVKQGAAKKPRLSFLIPSLPGPWDWNLVSGPWRSKPPTAETRTTFISVNCCSGGHRGHPSFRPQIAYRPQHWFDYCQPKLLWTHTPTHSSLDTHKLNLLALWTRKKASEAWAEDGDLNILVATIL